MLGKEAGEPVVVVARSQAAEYERIDFRALLSEVLGGLADAGVTLPRSGSAFIKPNMVISAAATEGVTTDPHFVAGLVALLRENGVSKVYVGDSSAGFLRSSDAFRRTGLGEAVGAAGGEVVDIDEPTARVRVALPESDILESLTVPRRALEADCLINFAKLKTHRVGSMTCCVKNWVGFLEQSVRLQNHQTRLAKLVSELHLELPEDLCFADGAIIGEGDGPDLTKPRFLGTLLASNDPVAIDVIGGELLGIQRGDLVFPWTAYLDGVGEIDPARIRLVGPRPAEFGIRAEKPVSVLYNRFPCHVVQGGVCDGCFAWFIGPALFWQRDGIWEKITKRAGTPTVMLGFNAVDRHFEDHLKEGPYFVIGDCAPAEYRTDSRTVAIPGCCPGPAIPDTILRTCGVAAEGNGQ